MFVEKLRLPSGGQETSIAPTAVSFATAARAFIDSVSGNSYFGPGQPMLPQATPGTLPRAFDYPFGANMTSQPRTEEGTSGISFQQMRALADNCDMVRLVIERRKQQISKIPWSFRLKVDGTSASKVARQSRNDPRVRSLTTFFARPDRQHPWVSWLSMMLEEVFVTDALACWPVFGLDGTIKALNLIDGATIKPLHDEQGWSPNPPNPAYQQFVKGVPAVNMTSGLCDRCQALVGAGRKPLCCNPLVYYPRNPRTHKFYGYSPVEWIIRTIMLSLNRQASQIAYFTEGNVPEMIVQAPEEWTREQIEQFQTYFDTKAGDMAARRRMTFVPATKGFVHTKEAMLSDDLDEWLARVICFAFGISAQPFIKHMNRATAQVASESAAEEGTLPDLNFIGSFINYLVQYYFGIEDVEFVWNSDDESDGLKQMRIDIGYMKAGAMGVDEVREDLGLPPIGVGNVVVTTKGVFPLDSDTLEEFKQSITQQGGGVDGQN